MNEKEAKLLAENEQLKASFSLFQEKSKSEIEELKTSFLSLQSVYEKSRFEVEELKAENIRLEELLHLFKLMKFGSKKDKTVPGQLSFLDELEMEITIQEIEEKLQFVKSHTRDVNKSKNLVNDDYHLPIEIVEHDIENKNCVECSSEMTKIGYEVRKELCIKPAEFYVKEHRYFKCVCNHCQQNNETTPIVIAPRNVVFPNSMASTSLVSQIIVDKYAKALPLYRQEQFYNQNNINLSRQNMANYMLRASELLKPFYEHLKKVMLANDIAHADETPLQVIHKDGKISTNKSYMWIYTSGRSDHLIYFYQYCKTRSGDYPYQFINGFKGYLLTDGYQGYNKIVKSSSNIIQVCCFAHARRRFSDVAKITTDHKSKIYSLTNEGLKFIDSLFSFEHLYEENKYDYNQIYEARLKDHKPILDEFYQWLVKYKAIVTPKSKLGEAINYTLEYWDELCNYLKDGRLELTNNRAERAAKGFVLGRKNWLFANTERGAEASAILYTIVQTALYNNMSVYRYLDYLLSNILDTKINQLDDLLPWSDKIPSEFKKALKKDE